MNKYNFDLVPDRRHTHCVKWDVYGEDELPLWVADMDFAVCPKIIDAMKQRLDHPVLGYSTEYKEMKDVICGRMKERYQWDITPEDVLIVPGIVSGFNFGIRAFCGPNDSVIYQTPAYPPFIAGPGNFGLEGIANDLYYDADDRKWKIDFDKFEAQIKDNTSLFVLCSPHNPVGRVFTVEELTRMGDICLKHNVKICSDEIHNEIVYSGVHHHPIASLSPELAANTVTFIAPSKTFNIPGLSCSAAIIQDPEMREKFTKALAGMNPGVIGLSQIAGLTAYRDCGDWLDELIVYLEGNRDFALDYIHKNMPALKTNAIEATFLMWLDCSALDLDCSPFEFFRKEAKVALNDGATFGRGYEKFVRLNFGTNRATLAEALERMSAAVKKC